jgi:hypothetical protein
MTAQDFTTSILVDQSPEEAFQAVTNVRGWWSENIEGETAKLHGVFHYHFEDVHRARIKLIEVIPNQKVVWLVEENYFNFTQDKTEWTGTKVSFDIAQKDGKTQVTMTHIGLVPEYECFDICSNAWNGYIGKSLFNLITTGLGKPNASGKPQTVDEERLSSENN